jgi:cytochrome b561
MALQSSSLRYGMVAVTLHWLIAALVIANIALGFYFGNVVAHSDPMRFILIQTHKSIGLTVLVLSLLRLGWRLVNPVPPLPADMSAGLKFLARATHVLLYVLIIAIPLAGWALVSSSPTGLPTMYFGLFPWPNLGVLADLPRAQKTPLRFEFATVHVYLAYLALALVVLHASAALWHHFVHRDNVLKRMLPGSRVPA